MIKDEGMKKCLFVVVVVGVVMLFVGVQVQDMVVLEGYQLQQVLIMSCYNLCVLLVNNGSVLEQFIVKVWLQWDVLGGQLIIKGGVLEVYMGYYMCEWLVQQKLVISGECLLENVVYVYVNSLQCIVVIVQFFIIGVFLGCGILVYYQFQMGIMDLIFNLVIIDDFLVFCEKVLQVMEKECQGMQLIESYKLLEMMIDYCNLFFCKEKKVCFLSEGKDIFSVGYQQELGVFGLLKVGNLLVDVFIL